MALQNCIFVSVECYKELQKVLQLHEVHIQINNVIFYVRECQQCQDDQIILNSIQRKQANVSLLNKVEIKPYFVNVKQDYFLEPATIVITPRKTPPFNIIDTDELNKILQENLNQRPVYYDAPVVFQYKDVTFEAILKNATGIKIITKQTEFCIQLNSNVDMELSGQHKQGLQINDSPLLQFIKKSIENIDSSEDLTLNINDVGIGGLNSEFSVIFQRLFLPRLLPPQLAKQLKLQSPKGLLMYGPPGCGKTLTARKIGNLLNVKSVKMVSGPEILNSYVGKSEENIRNLFSEAEEDFKQNGADCGLHLIIMDELDAICKQRGSKADNTGVGDSVVNQLLAKMDGVDEVDNFIIIGMTNRLDLIDSALKRPGRFEVQMLIPLPDKQGREEIFNIQLNGIKHNGYLADDVNVDILAQNTPNYSGAEIKGVVNAALSYAEARVVKQKIKNEQLSLLVSQKDLLKGIKDVEPQFGRQQQLLDFQKFGMLNSLPSNSLIQQSLDFFKFIKNSKNINVGSILIGSNYNGVGCSSIAQEIAQKMSIDFQKLITAQELISTLSSEQQKQDKLVEIFTQAERVKEALILIDDLEDVIQMTGNGIRYSNMLVSTISILLKKNMNYKQIKLFIRY